MASPAPGYRPDIDGLRAVAVIPVVLYHAGGSVLSGGFIGVDVFFVISGFLITGILQRDFAAGRYSIIRFYERRVRRIFPALFVVVACTYLIGLLIFLPINLRLLAKSVIATTFFLSNMLFWSEAGYFDLPSEMKPLLHTWSLAVEEQFYILFPLALGLLLRLRKRGIALAWLAALTIASLLWSDWAAHYRPGTAFYMLPSRAWELLAGALLAMGLLPALASPRVAHALSLTGLMLIVAPMLILTPASAFPGMAAIAPCLGALLIIHAGAHHSPLGSRILTWPPLVFAGLISYSLYLWHWPIIVFARYVWIDEPTLVLRIGVVTVSVIAAVLTWRFIERPFRDPVRVRRPALLAAAVTAMIVAPLVALPALRDGLPGRLPPQVASLASQSEYSAANRECHRSYARRLSINSLCRLGAQGVEPSFLLVGDSHGGAIAPGLAEGARQAGVAGIQLTADGYRPLKDLESLDDPQKYLWMNTRLNEALAQKSIRLVVVAGYWWKVVAYPRYESRKGDALDGQRALRSGLLELVRHHRQHRFLILTDSPRSALFGASVASRAALFGRHIDTALARTEFDQMSAAYREVLEHVALEPNVELLDYTDVLCDARYCSGWLNGRLAYRDDNHLSEYAVMQLTPRFRDALSSKEARDGRSLRAADEPRRRGRQGIAPSQFHRDRIDR